jgi:hypothetical protein
MNLCEERLVGADVSHAAKSGKSPWTSSPLVELWTGLGPPTRRKCKRQNRQRLYTLHDAQSGHEVVQLDPVSAALALRFHLPWDIGEIKL